MQARSYLGVARNVNHPLHSVLKSEKSGRIKRGKSWMANAEETIGTVCELNDITKGIEWINVPSEQNLTKVVIQFDRSCRNWVHGANECLIQEVLQYILNHMIPLSLLMDP
jgi:hypothetical protein